MSNQLLSRWHTSFISPPCPVWYSSTGDWICSACAKDIGLTVGIEGHEYDAEHNDSDDEIEVVVRKEALVIDDSDDDEDDIVPAATKKRKLKKKMTLESDSDSD